MRVCSHTREQFGNSQVTTCRYRAHFEALEDIETCRSTTRCKGLSTPSPQRATSTPWTPLFPNSPVPQFQNQCQL